jgi:hypothetical protein
VEMQSTLIIVACCSASGRDNWPIPVSPSDIESILRTSRVTAVRLVHFTQVRKIDHCTHTQGCQMVYFQTKNPDLGKFRRVLQWKMLVYLNDTYLVYFMAIWYILSPFDIF